MSDSSPMSSFSDQMEHRSSTQNLLTRGGSESGSVFQTESGLYVTSFAAAIFIAAIVTIGVLFITIVVTLSVMLQSCQNSNAGVLQLQERSDLYNYCQILALHQELNKLEIGVLPSICKAQAIHHMKEGQYLRDLNWTMWMVNSYFDSLKPQADGLDAVLIDIDDMLASSKPYGPQPSQYRLNLYEESNQLGKEKLRLGGHILQLYSKLQACGWSLIFITRNSDKLLNETIENLISSGYGNWSSLIMRSEDEMLMESWEYFSRRRAELQNLGFRIAGVISSYMDALTGPCSGKRVFKLPRSFVYQ